MLSVSAMQCSSSWNNIIHQHWLCGTSTVFLVWENAYSKREKCVWFVLSSQSEKASVEQEEEFTSSPVSPLPQSDAPNVVDNPHNNSNNIVEVKDVLMPKVCLMHQFHCFVPLLKLEFQNCSLFTFPFFRPPSRKNTEVP